MRTFWQIKVTDMTQISYYGKMLMEMEFLLLAEFSTFSYKKNKIIINASKTNRSSTNSLLILTLV